MTLPIIYGSYGTSSGLSGGSLTGFYRFSTNTTSGDPGVGHFRLNNADPALATEIYISATDTNGLTRMGLMELRETDALYLASSHLSIQEAYRLTADAVNNTTWFSLSVTHEFGTVANFSNNSAVEVSAVFAGAANYLELSDTPTQYTGSAFKVPRVKATEDGLEFASIASASVFTEVSTNTTLTQGQNLLATASLTITVNTPSTTEINRVGNSSGTVITLEGDGTTINGNASLQIPNLAIIDLVPYSGNWIALNVSTGEILMLTALTGQFYFDTDIAATAPSPTFLKLNNATVSSVTSLAIHKSDIEGATREFLAHLRTGDAIGLYSESSLETIIYTVESLTDNTTWVEFAVSHILGSTLPVASEKLTVSIVPYASGNLSRTTNEPTVNTAPNDGVGSVLVNQINGEIYVNARDATNDNLWYTHKPEAQIGYPLASQPRNWQEYQNLWLSITAGATGGASESQSVPSWAGSTSFTSSSTLFITETHIYDLTTDKKIEYATGTVTTPSSLVGINLDRGFPADSGLVYWSSSSDFYQFDPSTDALSVIPSSGLSGLNNIVESPLDSNIVYLFTLSSTTVNVYRHELDTNTRTQLSSSDTGSATLFYRWGADDHLWIFGDGTKKITKFDPATEVLSSARFITQLTGNLTRSYPNGISQSGRIIVTMNNGDIFSISPDLNDAVKIYNYTAGSNYPAGYQPFVPLHSGELLVTLQTNTVVGYKFIATAPDGLSAYGVTSAATYTNGYRQHIMPDGKILLGNSTQASKNLFEFGYTPLMPTNFTVSRFHNPLGLT